ncbi:haloacid dehalogenase [Arthrobacter psychrolactophilus]|uniref:D,D-heptose 1,7-bisphosphate phosphatase n=1 Tax=Arthrobacter psychrolactophilus TaxID=92442 RepID=A0A2V5IKX2_9MICC|nr:HAD family hydrolase [Arthrobacter psychrolactophilus]PYI37265.1 haloacid dehalogenase [Arthrobacter psychrolactophilus]
MSNATKQQLAGVLFDRDGTLIHDVPYNGDPARVTTIAGARAAVDCVRRAGLKIGVISNQSGVGRGLLTPQQVTMVNARVEDLLGPFDAWFICPHAPEQGCPCRKPNPGMVLMAARRWSVGTRSLAVIGDIGADVGAALAAGARPVLVPTTATRKKEILLAPEVTESLQEAVALLLGLPTPNAPSRPVKA